MWSYCFQFENAWRYWNQSYRVYLSILLYQKLTIKWNVPLLRSTRSLRMLEFFVPLLDDCHLLSIIYYTGTEHISNAKARRLTSSGKIFLKQSRPDSLTATVSTLITSTESLLTGLLYHRIDQIPHKSRELWYMFYCGGSTRIRDEFRDFSEKKNIKFEHELFDW